MMNRILTAAVAAAVATAASWAIKRWLDLRYARVARKPREHIESWENEGGALAPKHVAVETSQVPR
jgi:hypothetical protein